MAVVRTSDTGKDTDRGDKAYSSTKVSSGDETTTGSSGANVDSVADKPGYGQGCAANDIIWSTTTKAQAGYILLTPKAKPGITCVLPGELPTVTFGSDGTEAGPAEQALSPEITLCEGLTAYAGVIPKTAKSSFGKLLKSIIVAGGDDPNPESLPVDELSADKPIGTNCAHLRRRRSLFFLRRLGVHGWVSDRQGRKTSAVLC
ncbi:hypothetical protein OHB49_42865 (plasmid) [Streptomyces sp. NBC_01717]|uniref:DUF4232 domain-containing protein n=1 Tax=Streptomyces sp. NBC_01717 TaxID=2975918 RepID=UPI002E2FA45D|nr:DUF4232 domain-containing protein [Streptomyces sp. NBC_01717]